MARLMMVSADSHAAPPSPVWEEFLESEYHPLLQELRDLQETYTTASLRVGGGYREDSMPILDRDGAIRGGGIDGVAELDRRLAEMDREGVAAEVVYPSDPRVIPLFFHPSNRPYTQRERSAGSKAHDRWSAAALGDTGGRLLLVSTAGTIVDPEEAAEHLAWVGGQRGFVATTLPGHTGDPALPPLYDRLYEPFWKAAEENNLCLGLHAGYGLGQGEFWDLMQTINDVAEPGSDGADAVLSDAKKAFIFGDIRPRRALIQLLLGGVFDRHPGLRLMVTELRADWIPATLQHLDTLYETGSFPARRRPSEYWHDHCMIGLSFIHRAEVEMRHEIGVESIMFGRDYPHPEGTWPNTAPYLRAALEGVPEDEARKMLGENLIDFFGLDRAPLRAVADRIGVESEDILSPAQPVDAPLIELFQERSGYLKPAEVVDVERISAAVAADADQLAVLG